MPPISNATARRLSHAAGYLVRGMFTEATEELAKVPRRDWVHPDFLKARTDLHMAKHEWDLVVEFGEKLARRCPDKNDGWISWAFALRELNRVKEAKAVLLEAEPIHAKTCGVLHYNLACYHCLLGELREAKRRLRIACKTDEVSRIAVREDPDLRRLRNAFTPRK